MTETVKTTLYLPTEMHAALKLQAEENRRSLNNEGVLLLEQGLGAAVARSGLTVLSAGGDTEPTPTRPRKQPRATTCEHRIPVSAYCGVCDE